MPLIGGFFEPALGGCEIGRDAAAEPIGLAEVELRVGIAVRRERRPDRDRLGIVRVLPGIDPARTDCAEAGAAIAISETAATKNTRFIAYAPPCEAYPT
jgi:hypothetical protein